MSFREKSAWITLITVLVVFGAYFGALLTGASAKRLTRQWAGRSPKRAISTAHPCAGRCMACRSA